MKKVYFIFTLIVLILGIVHATLTPVFYHKFTLDACWFAGSGAMLILIALFNILLMKDNNNFGLLRKFTQLANAFGLIFTGTLTMLMSDFQVYISLVAILVVFIFSVLPIKRTSWFVKNIELIFTMSESLIYIAIKDNSTLECDSLIRQCLFDYKIV